MNSFSISQMQQFSGIKAHTIRIWEKRYNGLKPDRSEGNTRYYSDIQLRRLLNIVSLMNSGHKVSELCRLTDKNLFDLINNQLRIESHAENSDEYYISQLIASGMDFDEIYFDKIFSTCILRYGLTKTYKLVLQPMLARVGLLWSKDELPPSQEHFISNILRKKIFSAVDSLPPPALTKDSWMLFLPEGELHEIGLLFAHYLIAAAGRKSIYLGQDSPLKSVEKAFKKINPDNILLFMVSGKDSEYYQQYLKQIEDMHIKSKIYISGNESILSKLKSRNHVTFISSVSQLEKILENNSSYTDNKA